MPFLADFKVSAQQEAREKAALSLQVCLAVTRFAKAIGEIHSLSRADLHLIALAHTLHLATSGEHSLREEPVPARAVRRGKKNAVGLPGWGESGGKWEDLDRMEEAEKAALEKAQGKPQGVASLDHGNVVIGLCYASKIIR